MVFAYLRNIIFTMDTHFGFYEILSSHAKKQRFFGREGQFIHRD